MIDLETLLIPQISDRCKKLRVSNGFTMEYISDKAAISRIEKGDCPKSGNFITETVLQNYVNVFEVSPQELIFGNDVEWEKTLGELFDKLFFTIRLKDLAIHSELYADVDKMNVASQNAVLSLAEMFAEYNLQRYNFLKSDESYMDSVNKELDRQFMFQGKFINIERDFRSKPINDDTVIDRWDITEKMWLMCKEKCISSFQVEVIDTIFDDFNFSTINAKVNQWINKQFNKDIVPSVVKKLKDNTIFKLGLLVKQLIQEFLEEDLSESFQTTVPVKTTRSEHINLTFDTYEKFSENPLSEEERAEKNELISLAFKMMQNGELPDDKLSEKFSKYGVIFEEVPEVTFTKEEDIDRVIARVISSRNNGTTRNYRPTFEESPVLKTSDFNSKEEMNEAFQQWYEDTHFNNQIIPGYFTNNSQVIHRLQEILNEDILLAIENFIHIQNNLLLFLTEEDLLAFAK
ncbi:helix-turn-helix domain-containing protein [Listeria sp. ILCC792]|uniref:helix-turn-helix domain-containing protein n=1 Tax=Listeria sp. ILCC792 TaxID=1918331 RepID=UPI000B587C80|nr:helix-turn-helix transcriptional regulator [Listeria sp. ILCC792]